MSADDDSEVLESEAVQGRSLDAIVNRLDGYDTVLDHLEDRISTVEAEKEKLRVENRELRETIHDLEKRHDARLNELDERTDMLRLVDAVDAADGQQRSKALLQHAKREAEQKRRDEKEPVVILDRNAAETALHHPDVDRTTIYADLQRVVRLVGDEDVCSYNDGELRLDFTEGLHSLGICGSSTTGSTGVRGEEPAFQTEDHNHG